MSDSLSFLYFGWPYFALVLAFLIVIMILLPPSGPSELNKIQQRLQNPMTLFCLGGAVYMLHQFEEHGIDFLGNRFAFQAFICKHFSAMVPTAQTCPASASFILGVNVGSVWISSLIGALLGDEYPLVGAAGCLSIPAVNFFGHVIPAVTSGRYNPGLLTSILLFAPYVAWTYRQLISRRILTSLDAIRTIALCGIPVHIVLLYSLILREKGVINESQLFWIQIMNGFMPLTLLIFQKSFKHAHMK